MQAKEIATFLDDNYDTFKKNQLFGRYITLQHIQPLIDNLPNEFKIAKAGESFQQRKINKITIGAGSKKILLWSQMHGNESTGTKAIFDLFNFLQKDTSGLAATILKNCTITTIPILNPDGSEVYTRVDSQGIDLNRDAVDQKAPESKFLNKTLREVNPLFCFNLHDQRTIFSIGDNNLPATLSFLAPSEDADRTLTEGRKITMSVIVKMNEVLQHLIPNQIGRYTDEFYPTATGDNFQKAGYNTILVEAGHFPNDYDREITRKYNFIALVSGIYGIATSNELTNYEPYFQIPNNETKYLDILYKNVFIESEKVTIEVGILFKEELIDGKITFTPFIEKTGDLSGYNANTIIKHNNRFVPTRKHLDVFIEK